MKKLIIALLFIFASMQLQAQEANNKNAKYVTTIKGSCDMCQKRIQKASLSVSGVKQASWNIETKELSLILNENKTSLLAVKTAIAGVGHDSEEVKASDEAYNKLHGCCKYER